MRYNLYLAMHLLHEPMHLKLNGEMKKILKKISDMYSLLHFVGFAWWTIHAPQNKDIHIKWFIWDTQVKYFRKFDGGGNHSSIDFETINPISFS